MLYEPHGDIFASDARVIINPVNCVGAMGKGLALAFARKYPAILEPYKSACDKGLMKPGGVQLIGLDDKGARTKLGDAHRIVANVATKDHWRDPSRLEWVDTALEKLSRVAEEKALGSVGVPMLGAGLGGLPWPDVRASIEKHFRPRSEKGLGVVVFGEAGPEAERAAQGASAPSGVSGPAYAGIGARDTPPGALERIEKLAGALARKGYVMRSGGAKGADTAFETGARAAGGSVEIYLPWNGFNDRKVNGRDVIAHVTDKHLDLAKSYHPAWERLGRGPRNLMGRNASQMLGKDLDAPSALVVCWTKNGEVVGGTGQSLRMAMDKGVPVLNLGDPRLRTKSMKDLSELADSLVGGVKLEDALKKQKREEAMAR